MNYVEFTMKHFEISVLISVLVIFIGIILFSEGIECLTLVQGIQFTIGLMLMVLPFAYWCQVAKDLWDFILGGKKNV